MAAEWSLLDTLLLADWNTRVVVLGTSVLGLASGVVGSMLVLRKRALLGDVVSHAMLPGVVAAFLVMQAMGFEGKSFIGLLVGAAVAGTLAAWTVPLLQRATGLKDDAIMGIVLGGGFGLGIALLGVAQRLPSGNQSGLETFIYGRAASMVSDDLVAITVVAFLVLLATVGLAKEFRLLCFDESFGRALGRPERTLDLALLFFSVLIIVVGLQAVGVILIIALLIIPAACARFWTDRFNRLTLLSGLFGAGACWFGTSLSTLAPKMPAGAITVLSLTSFFVISMLLGTKRGGLWRVLRMQRLARRTEDQHLLRAAAECEEASGGLPWSSDDILTSRSWTRSSVTRSLRRALDSAHVHRDGDRYVLSQDGQKLAQQVVRNHRLWELFLIHYADIASSHVDRDADLVEHVLDDSIITELEALLERQASNPTSPHPIRGSV